MTLLEAILIVKEAEKQGKFSDREQYGFGPADMVRDTISGFRKGGMKKVSRRQQSFNKMYANAGFGKRLGNGFIHPNRSIRASIASKLGASND